MKTIHPVLGELLFFALIALQHRELMTLFARDYRGGELAFLEGFSKITEDLLAHEILMMALVASADGKVMTKLEAAEVLSAPKSNTTMDLLVLLKL